MSVTAHDTAETKAMNVIVVGGSLAGLLAGVALKRLGHSVHILERNSLPLFQGNGAGILAGAETRDYLAKFDKSERGFCHTIDISSPPRYSW